MDRLLKLLALACCVITAAAQSTSSNQVPTNPDVVVVVGKKLRLRCPPISESANISWYKNDVELRTRPPRVRVVQEWVKFRQMQLEDTGIYKCKIVERLGQEWRNVSVTVQNPAKDSQPDELSKPRNIILEGHGSRRKIRALDPDLQLDEPQVELNMKRRNGTEELSPPRFSRPSQIPDTVAKPTGNTLRLRCVSDGNPKPNITWRKNNESPTWMSETAKRRAGAQIWGLTIENLGPQDHGNYTCRVCNTQGCIEHTFRVVVIESLRHRPILTTVPVNTTVAIGANATLNCEVLSDAHPNVQWYYGLHQSSNTTNKTLEASDADANTPGLLELENVTLEDEGWYTCIAENSVGSAASSAYLRVIEKLEEEHRPQPTLVNMTVSIKFNVSCEGPVCDFAALGSFEAIPRP